MIKYIILLLFTAQLFAQTNTEFKAFLTRFEGSKATVYNDIGTIHQRGKELHNVRHFSTFLLRVATNYAIDLLRKRRGHSSMPEDSGSLPGAIQLDLARKVATPKE